MELFTKFTSEIAQILRFCPKFKIEVQIRSVAQALKS